MSLNIVTVPIDVLPVVPQATGYLQPEACLDPESQDSGEFETHLAHFLPVTSSFLSIACIAAFLTTVFQPLRYEMVQALRPGWCTSFVMNL
jgi:hypothetical protein